MIFTVGARYIVPALGNDAYIVFQWFSSCPHWKQCTHRVPMIITVGTIYRAPTKSMYASYSNGPHRGHDISMYASYSNGLHCGHDISMHTSRSVGLHRGHDISMRTSHS